MVFRHPVPRPALAAVVAVAVLALASACGGDPPVSPLPVTQPSGPSDPAPSGPTVAGPPVAGPTRTGPVAVTTTRADRPTPPRATRTGTAPKPTRASERPSTCQGAIRYDLDVATEELALIRSLCLATGAVLRIKNIGPGEVTVDRPDLVSQNYAAGVVDIRFVRPGTVAVRIPQGGTVHTVTVVIR